MARCAVTGAAGYVGRHVVSALESAGWRTVRLDRRARVETDGIVAGDVREPLVLRRLVSTTDAVVHLAAWVHREPVSRDDAYECVAINSEATRRLIQAVVEAGRPQHVVFVSSVSVYGASFAGSVLPLFQWQIAHGGPVTATDADATRYFMLPSEAAQLVLQAGMLGKGAEVFFLDMGEPVRIVDLAHNVVRMAGLEPGRDVEIEVTGLRPGERRNESLVMDSEDLLPTDHNKILLVKGRDFDVEGFRRRLEQLRQAMAVRDKGTAVALLKAMTAPR